METKLALGGALFLLLWLMAGCGNENTKEYKTVTENKKTGQPAVSFMLDSRLIESTDYSCSWILTGKDNIFNLTVHYDRESNKIPPSVGFSIYNLESITLPINRMHGNKLSDNSGQVFSLGMQLAPGKVADMNEISFTDNYEGLASSVQLSLLDTSAKFVSGRFEGIIQNANKKVIKITKGKFDRIPLNMVYRYPAY